jgi:NAD(P)H-flavin reductase
LRLVRILYRNLGRGGTYAEVQALPGDAMRVKVTLPRPWRFRPGQHAYLYIPAIAGFTSHPFTVAWSDETQSAKLSDIEKLPETEQDIVSRKDHNLYFLIKRRTGMTETLWNRAIKSPDGLLRTKILLEGPYSEQNLESFGTVLLFAAGVGITHQIPHVRHLVRGYSNGTVATRRVVLVWVIQSAEHLEWIRDWMVEILSYPKRREVLKILIYVTRPTNKVKIHSPSSGVQLFPQRPNIQTIVDEEVQQSIGAIGVSVCGVGAIADDVRKASRSWMDRVNIEFQEESFSW